ncbi:hypothetical protein FGO68_gene9171 [Halteria grandinella]|uniref:Uncharacterized protein n=1 Tax=Halteria grandinella TaxID=5974 RepID=A0A8J8NGZ3_HALGN|nr:hypothetical protein FGO68_gene9171 [Halteria grandinella]
MDDEDSSTQPPITNMQTQKSAMQQMSQLQDKIPGMSHQSMIMQVGSPLTAMPTMPQQQTTVKSHISTQQSINIVTPKKSGTTSILQMQQTVPNIVVKAVDKSSNSFLNETKPKVFTPKPPPNPPIQSLKKPENPFATNNLYAKSKEQIQKQEDGLFNKLNAYVNNQQQAAPGGGSMAGSKVSPFSNSLLPLDQRYIYFDKVKALQEAHQNAVKPSIEEEQYVNQFDPKMQKNFSYTDSFKNLKAVFSLPLYSNEKPVLTTSYTPTQPPALKFLQNKSIKNISVPKFNANPNYDDDISKMFEKLEATNENLDINQSVKHGQTVKNLATLKTNQSILRGITEKSPQVQKKQDQYQSPDNIRPIQQAGGMITGQLKPPLHFLRDKVIHTAKGDAIDDDDTGNMRIKNMTIKDPSDYYKEALKRKNGNQPHNDSFFAQQPNKPGTLVQLKIRLQQTRNQLLAIQQSQTPINKSPLLCTKAPLQPRKYCPHLQQTT